MGEFYYFSRVQGVETRYYTHPVDPTCFLRSRVDTRFADAFLKNILAVLARSPKKLLYSHRLGALIVFVGFRLTRFQVNCGRWRWMC
jgi:hypothetical protein